LFLTGDIFKFAGGNDTTFSMNIKGIYEVAIDNNLLYLTNTIPVLLLSVLLPLISLTAIFLFRNRKLQQKLTVILIFFDLLLIASAAFYGITSIKENHWTLIPQFRMFIPVINLVLLLLAYRGIKKDENLVRSYDRLR
ncbi:MAG TPA: hypothetical protein DDW27_01930, partial [Bacteroidales bacterium]|nr:hypothetical protein [Bacteroidales bacterium]